MKGIILLAVAFGLVEPTEPNATSRAEPDRAIEAIQSLGGQVERDSTRAGSPIVAVMLHGYHVTDADLSVLDELTDLEVLDLTATRVTDLGLEHVRGLVHLRKLYLYDDQITDAGLRKLTRLTTLEHLNIAATLVTDVGLWALQRMPKLQSLNLSGTRITDDGLETLQEFKRLKSLYLVDTRTTAAAVEKLRRRLPDSVIEHEPRSILPRCLQPWWLRILSGG